MRTTRPRSLPTIEPRRWAVSRSCSLTVGAWLMLACHGGPVVAGPGRPSGPEPRIGAGPGVAMGEACTPTGPELCFNAWDDNCNCDRTEITE